MTYEYTKNAKSLFDLSQVDMNKVSVDMESWEHQVIRMERLESNL